MRESTVKIGEHFFYIKNHASLLYDFFNKNFLLVKEDENDSINMKIEIVSGFGTPFLNYEVKTTITNNRLFFQRADYLVEVDHDFTDAKIHVHNDLALKHALMNLYSCYIVHIKWGILLHSSCVIENQRAHIFSGKSGAGKSTAAKLSYPRSLLSDEATILKITADKIIAYDSPFRSEITSKSEHGYYSIESIHLLHQSLTNKRCEMVKSDSFLLLLDKVFYWTYEPMETKKIFALLKKVVDHVPVYDLYFQKNNTFWEMIS